MKPALIIGVLLLMSGIASLITFQISVPHPQKEVASGSIHGGHASTAPVRIEPILSGVAVLCGLCLLVIGAKKR